jgi:hypothetical protein
MGVMFAEMGFMRWPLGFSLLVVLALSVWSAMRLFGRSPSPDLRTKTWIDAILFWGGFAMVAGVLGTLVGIVVAAQAIELAREVSTSLVWGGVRVSMLTSVSGAVILGLAALLWFALQLRWRLLLADHTSERVTVG